MYKYQQEAMERMNPYYRMVPIKQQRIEDPQYMTILGSASHTYGNVIATVENWVLGMFPEKLFKTIHVNSKLAHRQIKESNHEFLKKSKPMIIFRPRIDLTEERFLKGTSLMEVQHDMYTTYGETNLQNFFEDPKSNLNIKFQMNRSVLYIDVICIFSTLMQQIDYITYIQNAILLNRPFDIPGFLESYIPLEMIGVISDITGIPVYSEDGNTKDFLEYMEGNSTFPITYKLQGQTRTHEFFRLYPANILTEVSDLSFDEGNKSGHISTEYQISFTIRTEFNSTGFYYLFHHDMNRINLPVTDPEDSSVIPFFCDVIMKEDLNLRQGWHLYNQASIMIDKPDDEVKFDSLVNESIKNVLNYHISNGLPLLEWLDIKVRQNGKLLYANKDYTIDYENLVLKFIDKNIHMTYKILICVNVEYINDLIKNIYNLK